MGKEGREEKEEEQEKEVGEWMKMRIKMKDMRGEPQLEVVKDSSLFNTLHPWTERLARL